MNGVYFLSPGLYVCTSAALSLSERNSCPVFTPVLHTLSGRRSAVIECGTEIIPMDTAGVWTLFIACVYLRALPVSEESWVCVWAWNVNRSPGPRIPALDPPVSLQKTLSAADWDSLEKMWFSFGRSGSCGMQDAGNISFWKISCWHFWVWDVQRGSQARAKTKDIKCTWSLIRANWQTTVSSTQSCSEAKSCLAAFYSGECQRHSEGFILTLISTVCHKLWFYNKLQAFGVGEHHTLGLHQLQTNRPKDGTAPTVSKYISVLAQVAFTSYHRSCNYHSSSFSAGSFRSRSFTPSKLDEAPTVVKVWMVPPLHELSDSARPFPVFGTADIHVKFSGLKFTVWIWLKIQPKEFHTAPSVTVWGQDLLLFSTTFSVTSCIAGHV